MQVRTAPTLFSVALLLDVCAGLVSMAVPLTLKSEFGLKDDLIGVIIGTTTIVYMVTTTYAGILADRYGAIVALKLGIAIVVLDCLVFSYTHSFWVFILCTVGSPLGHAFIWPSFQAWFGQDVDRRETARRVGIFSVGWSIGLNIMGPKLAGDLMEVSSRYPFMATWIIALGVFCFFQFLRPELPHHEVHPTKEADDIHPPVVRRLFLRSARLANLMAVYSMVTLRNFFPLVCVDWGLTPSTIGTVVMLLGISHCLSFLVLSLTHHWHYRSLHLLIGQAVGFVGLGILGIGGLFWLTPACPDLGRMGIFLSIPALILTGMMAGIAFMSSAFYGLFGEEEKGKNSGVNEAIIGLAGVLALYFGGGAVRWFGSMGPYLTCSVLIGICLVFQVVVLRPRKNT